MPAIHEPQIVNTIGHSAGAVIFGIFLFLLFRDRAGQRLRGSWRSVTAAALAFLWNAGSLAAIVALDRNAAESGILVALSFSILSFLPAVLLDLSLDGSLKPAAVTGYAMSAVAVILHLLGVAYPALYYQRAGLLLITAGFGTLTLISVAGLALQGRGSERGKASRMAGAMCSALFAMSFVHLSSGHPAHAWSSELALHHCGIPLALFVLLQDYRFVLLDAFIRFLANVMLASLLVFVLIRAALALLRPQEPLTLDPLLAALVLTSLCLLLIGFAVLRGQLQHWLTRVVFRRPELEKTLEQMRSGAAAFSTEADLLPWAAQQLAEFVNAPHSEVLSDPGQEAYFGTTDLVFPAPVGDVAAWPQKQELGWVEALVPLRLSPGGTRYILLGRRVGGRRYLSEDFQALSRLAAVVVEHVERLRRSELQQLVSQAELKALQSQINPHFLFNALNTLYGIIPREAVGARRTVLNLSEIFRYSLQSEKTFIRLDEELAIVQAYLEIERLRLGSRLRSEIDVDHAALAVRIPVLSIQPLVENAVKHGLSKSPGPGTLTLRVRAREDEVSIEVADTGPGMAASRGGSGDSTASGAGLGLSNVRQRLKLCYGPGCDLAIASGPSGTRVQFSVPAISMVGAA